MSGLYSDDYVEGLRTGVQSIVAEWGLSLATQVRLLTISENATFIAQDPAKEAPVILRVHRPGYHTRAEIESELAWIAALRSDQVARIAAPLACLDGGHVVTFDHDGEARDVVGFSFVAGKEPSPVDNLASGFRDLGAISARLHQHAQVWQRPDWFRRKDWTYDTMIGDAPHWGHWAAAADLTPDGNAILSRTSTHIRRRLDVFGHDSTRYGLIHADLRLANLLVDPEGIAVIDFDDCGFGWFASDFAASISFIETDPAIPDLLDAWLTGYRSVAELEPAAEAEIPTFITMRRMQLLAWIASHAETPTAQEFGAQFTRGTLDLAEAYLTNDAVVPQA